MPRLFGALTILLFGCLQLPADVVCVNGTLASYVALGSGGCKLGTLTVSDFAFSVISSGGGAIPVSDTDILVTTVSTSHRGLQFSNFGSVSGSGFVNYLIGYTWDPTTDIRGAGDILDPGPVDITTDGCVGAGFVGPSCSGTPISLHVFDGGTPQLTDIVYFTPDPILGIRNTISMNAMGGTAAFTNLENDVYQVPEAGSVLLLLAFSVLLAGYRRTFSGKPS